MRSKTLKSGLAVVLILVLGVTLLPGCTFLMKGKIREYLKKVKSILETIEKTADDMDYLQTTSIPTETDESLNKAKEEWGTIKKGLKDIKKAEKKFSKVKSFDEVKKLHNQIESMLTKSKKAFEKANAEYEYMVAFATIDKKYEEQAEPLLESELASDKEFSNQLKQISSLLAQEKQELEKLSPPKSLKKIHQAYLSLFDQVKQFWDRMVAAYDAQDLVTLGSLETEIDKGEEDMENKENEIDKEISKETEKFNSQLRRLRKTKAKIDKEVTKLETKYNLHRK